MSSTETFNSRKIFYIADWHYDHRDIIFVDNRPFASVSEMNHQMIERWNRTVTPNDIVYILGDMFACSQKDAALILGQLHGTKVLIKGNHDLCDHPAFSHHFQSIADYMEIEDHGQTVVLCHYPIPCFNNHFDGWYHLYGHVHMGFEWELTLQAQKAMEDRGHLCQMYNVGAMLPWMDYTPRTLDQIVKMAKNDSLR